MRNPIIQAILDRLYCEQDMLEIQSDAFQRQHNAFFDITFYADKIAKGEPVGPFPSRLDPYLKDWADLARMTESRLEMEQAAAAMITEAKALVSVL